MKIFSDSKDRQWELAINVGQIKRVRELLDVDLSDLPVDGELLSRLQTDDVLLVNVAYVLVRQQAEEQGVTDIEFGESMDGPTLDQVEEAFFAEMLGFFRSSRRKALEMMLQESKQRIDGRLQLIEQAINNGAMDKLLERDRQELQRLLDRETSGEPSGSLPESSESIQTPTHLES